MQDIGSSPLLLAAGDPMASVCSMRVLITGACGFIGGVVAADFEACGITVMRLGSPRSSDMPSGICVNLLDSSEVRELDSLGHFDALVHCAAVLPGNVSDIDLLLQNQRMTYNLIDWAIRQRVGHVIFASTCRVYGTQAVACREDAPLKPPDMYTAGKVACEHIAFAMLQPHKIPCSSLRISAPYGPHAGAATVVRRFLEDSAAGIPLVVSGSGSRSQDFVFEADVAEAFRLALAKRAQGFYNISGNSSVSSYQLALEALRLFSRDPDDHLSFSGVDAQEHFRGCYPTDAALAAFGFRPRTELSDGLRKTAAAWGLL